MQITKTNLKFWKLILQYFREAWIRIRHYPWSSITIVCHWILVEMRTNERDWRNFKSSLGFESIGAIIGCCMSIPFIGLLTISSLLYCPPSWMDFSLSWHEKLPSINFAFLPISREEDKWDKSVQNGISHFFCIRATLSLAFQINQASKPGCAAKLLRCPKMYLTYYIIHFLHHTSYISYYFLHTQLSHWPFRLTRP